HHQKKHAYYFTYFILYAITSNALHCHIWRNQCHFERRRFKKIKVPVLVISGGQDSMFSQEMGEALAAVFPHGEHLRLPEAGHLMIAEYPEIVNSAIADFVEKIAVSQQAVP
ncbi:MAG: alpha/beta hydrolase, partial [Phormidesmis sp.]